jgi:lipid II:glycine glycyltransferase (peptidoglycan interpeptide bridge formation enzyme)
MNFVGESALRVGVEKASEDPQWDQFLESVGGNHYMQTARWAKLKSAYGWQTMRLLIRQGEGIVAGIQILYREIRFFGRVGYAATGPVFLDSDPQLSDQLFEELDRVVRLENFTYLMIQPPSEAFHCLPMLRARGFRPTPFHMAPTATVLIDLRQSQPEWLTEMRKSTRRAIRLSLASGLNVRIGGEADLPAFHSLLAATGQRQSFTPQPLEYFWRMWQAFTPGQHIILFLAELEGELVSGELDITFGDSVVSKQAGWSGRYGQLHPNERVIWEALNWAKDRGFKQYDLDGFDLDLAREIADGDPTARTLAQKYYAFKLGLGGRVVMLCENYEYFYGKIGGWAHRNLWLKFIPTSLRRKFMKKIRLG